MASIAKLAVILSAVTKPLEDGLKGAQSKMDSFAHGAGHVGKLFTGLFILDSVEKGFKKAIKGNEELNEMAEKTEASFGRMLLHLTAMSSWLPTVAKEVGGLADRLEGGFIGQEIKEKFLWLYEYSKRLDGEKADRVAALSRQEFMAAKLKESAALRLAAIERERFEKAREAAWVQMAGTEAQKDYLKELEGTYKSLAMEDPAYKKGWIEALRKDAGKSSPMGSVDYLTGEIAKLEAKKKAEEDLKKLMEDGKQVIESVLNPLEKLAAEQDKYNKMLLAGAINSEAYNRAIKAITPGLKDIQDIQKEIFKVENGELAAKLKEMAEAGASKETQKEYGKLFKRLELVKEMDELKKEMEKDNGFGDAPERQASRFAGADQAGSRAAYSAILRAQDSMPDKDVLEVQKRHVGVSQDVLKLTRELVKKQGDAVEALQASRPLKVITFGGG